MAWADFWTFSIVYIVNFFGQFDNGQGGPHWLCEKCVCIYGYVKNMCMDGSEEWVCVGV